MLARIIGIHLDPYSRGVDNATIRGAKLLVCAPLNEVSQTLLSTL